MKSYNLKATHETARFNRDILSKDRKCGYCFARKFRGFAYKGFFDCDAGKVVWIDAHK